MSSTAPDSQPGHSRTASDLDVAGTGRHRGRQADGEVWTLGADTTGRGRHRRTTLVVAAWPAPPGHPDKEPVRQLVSS
ncbi:hypothetical protein ACIP2X_08875 [Streptomyces sp. NPDC089424]|uniref:hypothetical protein n=1 Tax=Streptomyces sp. NPDC089424 TaxID=3365917 RepID=UPI00382C8896